MRVGSTKDIGKASHFIQRLANIEKLSTLFIVWRPKGRVLSFFVFFELKGDLYVIISIPAYR